MICVVESRERWRVVEKREWKRERGRRDEKMPRIELQITGREEAEEKTRRRAVEEKKNRRRRETGEKRERMFCTTAGEN